MTPLSSIRLLIGLDLNQKGLPSSIITPILTILKLADEEMTEVGFDFEDPQIHLAVEELEKAIAEMNGVEPAYIIEGTETARSYGLSNISEIETSLNNNPDPLSYLDDDDGN